MERDSAFSQTQSPERRVVLLGASNLVRGMSPVLEAAWQAWGQPLDFVAAIGHGRSFGATSRVLARTIPGIAECGLWTALERSPPVPTAALITDIGNDLLYEIPVEQIAWWVDACLERLARHNARVVMTLLPVCSLESLSQARFRLFRTLFFPRCRLPLAAICDRVHELNERVRALGAERGATLVEPRAEWYGFDPIHVRWQLGGRVWPEIFRHWRDDGEHMRVRTSLVRWLRMHLMLPEQCWLCGIEQRRPQPVARLRDGTQISFY